MKLPPYMAPHLVPASHAYLKLFQQAKIYACQSRNQIKREDARYKSDHVSSARFWATKARSYWRVYILACQDEGHLKAKDPTK